MQANFDPNQFLDQQFTEQNDTILRPIPEGEFIATATEATIRTWTSKDDPSKSGLALDIKWEIDDAEMAEDLGRKPVVKQGIMLDMTEGGGLDMGKGRNVGLGRLREAIGMNQAGRPFSFSMIAGNVARIRVKQRPDPKNSEIIYSEVKETAPL